MLKSSRQHEISNSPQQDFMDAKRKAKLFYDTLLVPERIEEILNDMLYDKPADVYGRLVNFKHVTFS